MPGSSTIARDEGIYGLTQPRPHVGSRHGQWSAISLYCLGRYFNKYYPDPIWAQCVRGGELAFQSLHEHAWVSGESDNLFWYNTGIAPIFTYMVLTGDRKPLENGVLEQLLRGQEILISGRDPDWALNSASLGLLNKAAYLTGDGRWITYRERTGVDNDSVPAWPVVLARRDVGARSCRPTWWANGPFTACPNLPGARGKRPAVRPVFLLRQLSECARCDPATTSCWTASTAPREIPTTRSTFWSCGLAGRTILDGYHNQVLTSADGMVEPARRHGRSLALRDVVGPTATAVGEVPDAAFCNWRRTLSQRTGRYALVVDDLTFRDDSQNMKVTTTWQVPGGLWDRAEQAIRLPPADPAATVGFELRSCDDQEVRGRRVVTMSLERRRREGRASIGLLSDRTDNAPNRPTRWPVSG